METLLHYINVLNGFIWGPPMILLIFGLGIYFTFQLGFIQKYTFKAIGLSVKKDGGAGTVSSFGSLAVMVGATEYLRCYHCRSRRRPRSYLLDGGSRYI